MAEYYLTPEAIQAGRQAVKKRMLLIAVTLLATGFCYGYLVLHTELITALFTCLLLIGALGVSYSRNIKQQKALLESYRLLIEPGSITRFLVGTPTIRLETKDIKGITQNAQGILTIASFDKYQHIYVPAQTTRYDQLVDELRLSHLFLFLSTGLP